MNLRELLLQFAGENGESLQLDDLLTTKVRGIEVEEELDSGLRVLVKNPVDLEETKDRIQNVLEQNGYSEYTITPEKDGPVWHIIIEAKK